MTAGVVAALLVSLAAPLLLLPALHRVGAIDVPVARSSHRAPTPRGGGLGLAAGLLTGIAVAGAVTASPAPALLLSVLCLGAVGLLEDVRGAAIGTRVVLQLAGGALVTGALVWAHDASPLWIPVGALACAVYVNAANFMDGIDGISGVHGVVTGVAFALLGGAYDARGLVVGGLCLAAASAGFLPWNAGRAHLFLGDVGSYALGAAVAVLAAGAGFAGVPVVACLAPLSIYLADTGVTLTARIRAGQDWRVAHRRHAYQRLVDEAGWSHPRVAITVGAATALAAAAGAVSLAGGVIASGVAGAGILLTVVAYLGLPGALRRARG